MDVHDPGRVLRLVHWIAYGEIARAKGFPHVASGPLVRSSYHAADLHPVVR